MKITVFTPAYDRAEYLKLLYDSLKKQTDYDFEWLIVDDGSTDNTEEVVKGFLAEPCEFPIVYEKRENGGKHRAVNYGVTIARGELFFIVDSDDILPPDAISTIKEWESALPKGKWAGVAGQKGYINGKSAVGSTFSGEGYIDATSLERYKYHIEGDKAEVIYTDVIRQFPFPEIEGERFITENTMWYPVAAAGYKFRWYNKIIYLCEYLETGLSRSNEDVRKKNPLGWLYSYKMQYELCKPLKQRLAAAYNYQKVATDIGWNKKKIKSESKIPGIVFFFSKIAKKLFGKK